MNLKPLRPHNGPILAYLAQLSAEEKMRVEAAIKTLLDTDEGSILMDLLDKAVQDRNVPLGAPSGALEDLNAQRFLVSDLLQITRPKNAYLDPAEGGVPIRQHRSRRT